MSSFALLLSVLLADATANLIPGPNFLLVMKHSMRSRTLGMATVGGLVTANVILFVFALSLTQTLVTLNAQISNAFKIIASFYLFYLGYRSIWHFSPVSEEALQKREATFQGERRRAWLQACVVCLTNPKSLLYFSSLSVILVGSDTSWSFLVVAACGIALSVSLSYGLVAFCSSSLFVRRMLFDYQGLLERFVGVCFILCGALLLLSPHN